MRRNFAPGDTPLGPVESCTHRVQHLHGTYLAFSKDRCRCEACVKAHRREAKAIAIRAALGTSSYVDATRAREHVTRLREVMTVAQIERRSGVNRRAISCLLGTAPSQPQSKRIMRATEIALLSVTAPGAPVIDDDHGMVPSTGTRRRIRALTAMGWSMRSIARMCGVSDAAIRRIAMTKPSELTHVRATTAALVKDLYDSLWDKPSDERLANHIRELARRRRWAPPLAWDDDTIEDPEARPNGGRRVAGGPALIDDIAVDRVLLGDRVRLTPAERRAALERGKSRGMSFSELAQRLGENRAAVERQYFRDRSREREGAAA